MALSEGGNVFGSKSDEIVTLSNNVKIINVSGYPKEAPIESSLLLSKARCYFLHLLLADPDTLLRQKNE